MPQTPQSSPLGLNTYQGPWLPQQVKHLLNRTLFGAKMADIQYFGAKTVVQAVDELLNVPSTLPTPPLNDYTTTNGVNGFEIKSIKVLPSGYLMATTIGSGLNNRFVKFSPFAVMTK